MTRVDDRGQETGRWCLTVRTGRALAQLKLEQKHQNHFKGPVGPFVISAMILSTFCGVCSPVGIMPANRADLLNFI